MTAAACNPNWRNTWLFAAGRLFTDSDHRRNLVVSIVERCDTDGPWPGWLYPAGPELAAHLLDDGLAASRPNAQRRLIDVALRCLKGPMPDESKAVAVGLSAATAANVKHRALIRNELARALAGEQVQRAVASALIWQGDFGSRIPGRYTDEDLRRPVDLWQYKGHPLAETVTVGALLRSAVQEWLDGDVLPEARLLAEALPEWDKLTLIRTDLGDLWPTTVPYLFKFNAPKTYEVLADGEASQLLEICLGTLQPRDWAGQSMLARAVWNVISRTAVSQHLGWPDPAEGGRDGQWYMSFPWGNATVPATR